MLVDFHSLYERYAESVHNFVYYLSGNASLAEEITQETFVRAWITPGKIFGGTVRAYLFTIARNLVRAEQKHQVRQVPLDEQQLDPRPGPDAIAGDHSEYQALLKALQKLPEIDRAALLLYAQQDVSYAEIAATLDLSLAAVKVRIHRARIKLKQLCDSN
jgi:RNA polymerase sigma-70 factor (ECF subfamily)